MKKILTFLIVVCILATTCLPAMAAEEGWYTGWTEYGTVEQSGDTITLPDSYIGKPLSTPGNKFDVELEYKVNTSSNGGNSIGIMNGTNRLFAMIYSGYVEYNIPGWAVGKNLTHRKKVMYPIGMDWHTYRFIGQGQRCEVYIDGYYMGEIEIETRTSSSGRIEIAGGTGQGASVRNVIFHDPTKVSLSSSGEAEVVVSPTYPAEEYFSDFVAGEDTSVWENNKVNRWRVEDGMLRGDNNMGVKSEMNLVSRKTGFADDFVVTARLRWPVKSTEVPMQSGILLYWDNCQFHVKLTYQQFTYYNGAAGRAVGSSANLTGDLRGKLNSEWQEIRIETYNYCEGAKFYLGDTLLFDGYIKRFAEQMGESTLSFYTEQNFLGEAESCMDVDWVRYVPITHNIIIEEPINESTYLQGNPIPLNALVKNNQENIPYVDYKINGNVVARGMAPDYEAQLTNIGQGNYTVTAEYGEQVSPPVSFSVVQAVKGSLNVKANSNGSYTLNAGLYDKISNVAKVQFVLDGVPVGEDTVAPYSHTLSSLTPEPHKLAAYYYSKSGVLLSIAGEDWAPTLTPNSASRSYTNEVAYTVTGGSGSGTYELNNGHHKVSLTHTPSAVTYVTADGVESFSPGTGTFNIITQGAVADVYRNGQFAFSFFLPQTSAVGQSYKQNGLTFTGKSISVPKERGTYYSDTNVTQGRYSYRLPSLPYAYRTVFVADKTDNARIAVNDSLFRTDVELKDGKFYVWTIQLDASPAERIELCDAVDADNVYYHIETVGGMNRIYGNGKFLSSFRSIPSAGEQSVLVEVNSGNGLSYVTVTDNKDVFIYNDDFTGSGEFNSVDYWQATKGMGLLYDKTTQRMFLMATGQKDAVAELTAYSGDTYVSADVIATGESGGLWMIYHHSHTEKWTKVGYNFETGKYEVIHSLDGTTYKRAEKEGTFPVGESVHLELVVECGDWQRTATLYVNGMQAISYSDSLGNVRGKTGFVVTDNFVYLENASYRGDARPVLSMTDSVELASGLGATCDIIELADGTLQVVTELGNSNYTDDGGKTWTKGPSNSAYKQNILQLRVKQADGTYALGDEVLSFIPMATGGADENGKALGNVKIWHSSDRGATWEEWGFMFPEPIGDTYFFTAEGVKQGPSGRLYAAPSRDDLMEPGIFSEDAGVAQCVYSDDGGRTWTLGGIVSYKDVKSVINEPQIVESHDGVVTMYYRTDTGMIRAVKSYDGGNTFDLEHIYRTPFLANGNCFGVTVDPIDGKTLYIAWGYDNANLAASNQVPRQRWSIARSMDDGVTWEFLGTTYECTYGGAKNTNMNTMMNVTGDYLMINGYCLDAEANIHTYRRIDLVRKDRLKGSKAFEQIHLSSVDTLETYWGTTFEQMAPYIVANDSNGVVYLNGRKVDGAAQNGEILLDCIASYIGATIESNEKGEILLTYGEAKIVIDNVTNRNGKLFVNRESVANQFGFGIFTTADGICYLGNTGKLLESIENRFKRGTEIAD